MWRSTLLCLCLCGAAVWAENDERESKLVNTAQGAVRGYKDTEHGIFAFQSIPYATAPTGPNRFKSSVTMPGLMRFNSNMQEDCLIANVYIPVTEDKNLPVFVYVHGGAFQMGWGNMLVPKKLVSEHNIIIVTFNYRIGIYGFLCLGTEDAPGNAGMKDQVELLRWVKKNIANFGGNPDDVTIAGHSAGSASVDLLMLSKSAEGLFNKVIPESGVSTSVFTIQSDPLENAKWFAKANNFTDVDDIYALEQFYKTAPFEILIKDSFFDRPDSTVVFSPCVERASKEAFLDESPVDILKNAHYKKLPVLHGFANMEGLVRIDFFDYWKNRMNETFSDFLPADLKFESEEQKEDVAKKVKEFYFGDNPVDEGNVLAYVDYFTDVIFAYSTLRSINLMVENGHDQIYLYEYSFVDENTPVVPHTNIKGANHCAQSIAVAGALFTQTSDAMFTEEFTIISSTLRQIWANFIKT
ncbi:Carboxylesterase, partial [Operophtera brumata]